MRIARALPPVGYRPFLSDLVRVAYRAMSTPGDGVEALEREFVGHFKIRKACAVSSGKAALTLILRALKTLTGRRKVILPAYACYSIPSSILKAGLDVVPCDIGQDSFDYDYDQLESMLDGDVLCVLSVHLFGIPSDTARLNEICRPKGIFVVEDAAQAMPEVADGIGTTGDVGFFSFGRGKNITCGSGGMVVTRSEGIANALGKAVRQVTPSGIGVGCRALTMSTVTSMFISPNLYWLPAGLPFLALGETIFYDDFPIRRLSNIQALLLRDWRASLLALNRTRRDNARFYINNIRGARDYGEDVPYLRFPLVLRDAETKWRLLYENGGCALGLSGMYPTSMAGVQQLHGRIPDRGLPEAKRVAASLVTLPTHPLVSERDRETICTLVNLAMDRIPSRRWILQNTPSIDAPARAIAGVAAETHGDVRVGLI